MRFFKLVWFDIRYGLFKNSALKKLLIWGVLFSLACIEFNLRASSFGYTDCTYGDYLLYIFGGMKEYIPDPFNPFAIPYLWLLNHILILFFTLHYMHDDLQGFGQSVLYRAKTRTGWWLSKCVWNIATVGMLYLVAWLVVLTFAFANGAELSLHISPFMAELMQFGPKQVATMQWTLGIEITLLPLAISIALSLMQMTLCLLAKPFFAFIASAVLLISSAYYLSPFLPGNYAMAVRSNKVVTNGVAASDGVTFAALLTLLSIAVGLAVFKKYDVLSKE